MSWTVSIIVCAVCLALWLAATIGEKQLMKKRGGFAKKAKKPQHEEERSGVYYGDRGYNNDRYKQF